MRPAAAERVRQMPAGMPPARLGSAVLARAGRAPAGTARAEMAWSAQAGTAQLLAGAGWPAGPGWLAATVCLAGLAMRLAGLVV